MELKRQLRKATDFTDDTDARDSCFGLLHFQFTHLVNLNSVASASSSMPSVAAIAFSRMKLKRRKRPRSRRPVHGEGARRTGEGSVQDVVASHCLHLDRSLELPGPEADGELR